MAEVKLVLDTPPSDPYAFVLFCKEVSEKLIQLGELYASKGNQELQRIEADGLISQDYEFITPTKISQSVNVGLLRIEQPSIFENIAHIKASDAANLIGSPRDLLKIVRDRAGLDKNLIERYIEKRTVELERQIVPKTLSSSTSFVAEVV